MDSLSDGFYRVDAYTNGYEIVICGTLPELEGDDPLAHSCDAMGCGSIHVVARIPVLEPTPELSWGRIHAI